MKLMKYEEVFFCQWRSTLLEPQQT